MTLKKTTQRYELLIRFSENEKVGAQMQTITVIKDGANIVSASPDDVVSLSLKELQAIVSAFTSEDWFAPAPPEVFE